MNEELKSMFDTLTNKLEDMKSTQVKAEDVNALRTELEALKGLESKLTDEQTKQFNALKEEINGLKEGGKEKEEKDNLKEIVTEFVTKNIDAIKSLKGTGGELNISKAVGTVTSANGTLTTPLPANFVAYEDGVPNVSLRRATILDHVRTFNTNKPAIPYLEAEPKEGDFAVVAEGGLKPQLDLKWNTNWIPAEKFAGWIKLTDEVLDDIPRLIDVITNFLRDKHDLAKEKIVFNYINTNSTAYVTGGGLSGSVIDPNIMDVVGALDVQIISTPNYVDEPEMQARTILMNPLDFFKYFSFAKDMLGRPLFPDGFRSDRREVLYNGYRFVSTTLVTVGNIYAYDHDKIDVTNYIPYHVKFGHVDDDFIRNQFAVLGESRGHIYIKRHDRRAFVKGSISAIIEDLKQADAPSGN